MWPSFIWERVWALQPARIPARRYGRHRPLIAPARRHRPLRPDVSTSSIKTKRRPAMSALCLAGTRKAPCTLSARSVFDRPTCCGVARTRLNPYATGTLQMAEIAPASAADWLKRRVHCLRQCSGIGTSASASANSSRPARAVHRPIMGARSSRSLYLKPWTSVRAISS